jgi:ADP-heptose:LPS heptosyltransferase
VKIRVLKLIDRIFGMVAVRLLWPPGNQAVSSQFASILLIRPGGIGDAVHLVPAINALKSAFPNAAIDILAERRNAGVFALSTHIRKVMRYDVPAELLSTLRRSYDVVIDTEQWHRLSAIVARLTRAQLLIGFDTNERRRLFNFPVSYAHDDYEVSSFLRLLEPLGITPDPVVAPWLTLPEEAAAMADQLLGAISQSRFVVIFPGASIPERQWGGDRFRLVAETLAREQVPVVVVGGPDDAAEGEEILSSLSGLNLAGRTTLAETAAVIARAAVLLSGDSGILHIGVALGIPTVSLFGPGIAAKWAPKGARHVVINKGLSCSPCTRFGYTSDCPFTVRCMSEIGADEVYDAVRSSLNVQEPRLSNNLLDNLKKHC